RASAPAAIHFQSMPFQASRLQSLALRPARCGSGWAACGTRHVELAAPRQAYPRMHRQLADVLAAIGISPVDDDQYGSDIASARPGKDGVGAVVVIREMRRSQPGQQNVA